MQTQQGGVGGPCETKLKHRRDPVASDLVIWRKPKNQNPGVGSRDFQLLVFFLLIDDTTHPLDWITTVGDLMC